MSAILLALALWGSAGWSASEQRPGATEQRAADQGSAQQTADTVAVASRLIAAGEPEKALALLRRAMRAEGADTEPDQKFCSDCGDSLAEPDTLLPQVRRPI